VLLFADVKDAPGIVGGVKCVNSTRESPGSGSDIETVAVVNAPI